MYKSSFYNYNNRNALKYDINLQNWILNISLTNLEVLNNINTNKSNENSQLFGFYNLNLNEQY